MKRILCLLMALSVFLCSCKQSEVAPKTSQKSEPYELKLSSYSEMGDANWYSEDDLIGSATLCDEEELLCNTKIKYPGEYEEPNIFLVNGQLFSIDAFPNNKTRLALVESTNSGNSYHTKEIEWAQQIQYFFEKDGFIVYCSSNGNKHKLMKYDIKNKTAYMLNETLAEKSPDYYNCGDYIAIIPPKENGSLPKHEVSFCNFESGQLLENTLSIDRSTETPIIAKNIKNNYFITYSHKTKQLLFYDILKEEIASQILYTPNLLRTKIIGNYLVNCDADGVKLYDFETKTCSLIYYHDWQQDGVETCTGRLIGDNFLIHVEGNKPLLYNLKTKKYTVIESVGEVTELGRYADDGESAIAFVVPYEESKESSEYPDYTIKKYEIK